MDSLLTDLATNKLFNGCIMLITNIGGRYLAMELPQNVDVLFSKYTIMRFLVMFCIFFMATRDIKISILLLLFFFIIIKFFFNENSKFCLVKDNNIKTNKISVAEYNQAKKIIDNYTKENQSYSLPK
jgi:uncharacterized membrane protein